jgi:hypothetical protein
VRRLWQLSPAKRYRAASTSRGRRQWRSGSGLLLSVLAGPRRLARQVLRLALVAKAAGPEFGGQRVRGVAQDGSDLVISHDYISHGLRSRVEDPTSAELGAKPEHEIVPCGRRSPTPCARDELMMEYRRAPPRRRRHCRREPQPAYLPAG